MKPMLTPAAAMLIRAIRQRCGLDQEGLIIGKFRSIDWQSLTFTGERHELSLCFASCVAAAAVQRLKSALDDYDWGLVGHVVADIVIADERREVDGSVSIDLEALTLKA